MLNEQGDYEGDAQWEVVKNSIGHINYVDSVDLVCNPHYEHPTRPTRFTYMLTSNYLVKRTIDSEGCLHGRVVEEYPCGCFIVKLLVNSLNFS